MQSRDRPRSQACQTEPDPKHHAFQRMSEEFYTRLGTERNLISTLKKTVFESHVLFYLVAKM